MPGFYNAVIYARYPDIHLYQNITRVQFHPGEYPHKIRPGKGGGERWGRALDPVFRFFCTRVPHPAEAYLIDIPNVVFFLNPSRIRAQTLANPASRVATFPESRTVVWSNPESR